MLRGRARARAVLDADEERPRELGLVDHDDGQPALERGLQRGVVVGHAVEAERADDRLAHGLDLDPVPRCPGSSSSS